MDEVTRRTWNDIDGHVTAVGVSESLQFVCPRGRGSCRSLQFRTVNGNPSRRMFMRSRLRSAKTRGGGPLFMTRGR